VATTEPFSVNPIVAKEISEHIHLSLNAIDAQLKEQLSLGTQWLNALLDAQINSKNIARLSQWFYWVDGLPNQCQQLTETLVPLLNTASTSPILLSHGEKGHISFTLNQHAVNDCPATAQTLTTAIDNTLSDQPFLLSARGVNSGLVSSHWLTIAEAIEQLANLPLIVHSSLVEDTAETFSCKTTTTDWDDQTAVLMEKYSQEAINFLAQDQTLSRALEKNDFKEALILNKLSMLINTLGNTAQNNLSITPSTTLTGRLNELAQSSERFSRFLPYFLSTINYTEALGISDSMRELTICVDEHTRNQWLNIVNIAETNILLKRPNNHETDVGDIHPFSSEDELEQWWDEELQALEALFEYSAPYMSYLSNLKREDTNNRLSPALASWENAQKERRDYQDANDNNQVSQLYSLYKKALKLEKQECDNFLQENSRLFSEFGNDIFSQRRQTYAADIRTFCNGTSG